MDYASIYYTPAFNYANLQTGHLKPKGPGEKQFKNVRVVWAKGHFCPRNNTLLGYKMSMWILVMSLVRDTTGRPNIFKFTNKQSANKPTRTDLQGPGYGSRMLKGLRAELCLGEAEYF